MKRRIDLEEKLLDFLYSWLRPIRIGDLKKELEKENTAIPHSSINSIIKRLVDDELITWQKYGPISLTQKGQQQAAHKQRHFHLLIMFFMNTLNLSHREAKKESYAIASVISCNMIDQISRELNNPQKCHCNESIPRVEECIAKS